MFGCTTKFSFQNLWIYGSIRYLRGKKDDKIASALADTLCSWLEWHEALKDARPWTESDTADDWMGHRYINLQRVIDCTDEDDKADDGNNASYVTKTLHKYGLGGLIAFLSDPNGNDMFPII
jgi:hypothetical protein